LDDFGWPFAPGLHASENPAGNPPLARYLGMVLLCLGAGFLLDSLWFLALCAPLAIALQRSVIEPEEAYLEQKFGEKYLPRRRVRRGLARQQAFLQFETGCRL
jgi:hypothetical protein